MPGKNEPPDGEYEIGYGKPPRKSQFQKGRSGNPKGRPRGISPGRAKALALKEAYRMVNVKEGDTIIKVPMIQAVMRGQMTLAAKGNVAAQRFVIETVQGIERDAGLVAAEEKAKAKPEMSQTELARRIAFALQLAQRNGEQQKRETAAPPNRIKPTRK